MIAHELDVPAAQRAFQVGSIPIAAARLYLRFQLGQGRSRSWDSASISQALQADGLSAMAALALIGAQRIEAFMRHPKTSHREPSAEPRDNFLLPSDGHS